MTGLPRTAVLLATLAVFSDLFLFEMVVPFLPEHLQEQHVSETGIGLLFSAYAIASLATALAFGRRFDRIGRRAPILIGLIGLAGAAFLSAAGGSFFLLMLARIIQGASGAALGIASLALVADLYPMATRGKPMGLVMTGMSTGILLGPVVGGALFEWGGYALPFLVAGGLALAVGAAVALLLEEPARKLDTNPSEPLLLRDWSFVVTLGAVVVGATLLSFLEPTLPIFLTERLQATPAAIGLLFCTATIAYGLGSPLASMLSDRWGSKRTMAVGLLGVVVTLPFLALARSGWVEACVLAGLGLSCGFLIAPALPDLADSVDEQGGNGYGRAYAWFDTANAAGTMIGPVLGGALTTELGFARALLLTSLAAVLYVPVLAQGRRPPVFVADGRDSMV